MDAHYLALLAETLARLEALDIDVARAPVQRVLCAAAVVDALRAGASGRARPKSEMKNSKNLSVAC